MLLFIIIMFVGGSIITVTVTVTVIVTATVTIIIIIFRYAVLCCVVLYYSIV